MVRPATRRLGDLEYADDAVPMAECIAQLRRAVRVCSAEAEKLGWNKRRVM